MTPNFLPVPLKICYANIYFLNTRIAIQTSNAAIRNTTSSTSSLGGGRLGELLHYRSHHVSRQNTHEITYTPIE
ncbi:hypothetical protein GIB67_005715 [Kingdonia uniflora]|uniref:Uncharacterized protein n=1 Tax=Kingdonia uniflora TaxID=39325 RepID=A0A7J7KVD3_9MAGN|nr:hypothetical protein GIB67_005715 [Kingdonia uniflora]